MEILIHGLQGSCAPITPVFQLLCTAGQALSCSFTSVSFLFSSSTNTGMSEDCRAQMTKGGQASRLAFAIGCYYKGTHFPIVPFSCLLVCLSSELLSSWKAASSHQAGSHQFWGSRADIENFLAHF